MNFTPSQAAGKHRALWCVSSCLLHPKVTGSIARPQGGTVGTGQPELGSDWHKEPSLEVRLCPARPQWGGEAAHQALLLLIAGLITESAVLAGCQDGSFGFFFVFSSPSFNRIKLCDLWVPL